MVSLFTETIGVRPNSEPQPTVQPALLLDSLWEGHPAKGTIVGCELVLHTKLARSCAITAPPFTYTRSRSQYVYPTRAVAVDSQFKSISQLKKKPFGQGRAPWALVQPVSPSTPNTHFPS